MKKRLPCILVCALMVAWTFCMEASAEVGDEGTGVQAFTPKCLKDSQRTCLTSNNSGATLREWITAMGTESPAVLIVDSDIKVSSSSNTNPISIPPEVTIQVEAGYHLGAIRGIRSAIL